MFNNTIHAIAERLCLYSIIPLKNDRHLRKIIRMYLEERLYALHIDPSFFGNSREPHGSIFRAIPDLVFHDVASYIHNRGPPIGLSFKTIVRCIMTIQQLYTYTLEDRYAPGGIGYIQARDDFNQCVTKQYYYSDVLGIDSSLS